VAYCLFLQQIDAAQPGPVPGVFGDTGSLVFMVLKVILMLGAVCILIPAILKFGLPRMNGMQAQQGQLMKVVARFPLEAQKTLYVVEITGKHLLLGVSQERIEVLTELDGEAVQAELDKAALELAAKPGLGAMAMKEFSKYLRR
jgi:flagellar biosynthetic protein FliO